MLGTKIVTYAKAMSSRITSRVTGDKFSKGLTSGSPSYPMGGSISQKRNSYRTTTNSEYGKGIKSMGTTASTKSYVSPRTARRDLILPHPPVANRSGGYGSYEGRKSPTSRRPLPSGPGPLFPPNSLKQPKRNQESVITQVRGPVKANHQLMQREISNREGLRESRSPPSPSMEYRSLSRLKSRSLNDVRQDNTQSQKASADKLVTEADLVKARKSFKISRSPSFDNINASRQVTEKDQRALLDKMSKMRTDEALRRQSNDKLQYQKRSSNPYISKKMTDPITGTSKTIQYRRSSLSEPNASQQEPSLARKANTTTKEDRLGKSDAHLQEPDATSRRKLSDSAYESSSSNECSSPGDGRNKPVESEASTAPAISYGKGLVGLRNLGNTCFMNSIIQCLRHTKKLRDLFFCDDVLESAKGSSAPTKGLLAKAFRNIVRETWEICNPGTVVSPSNLKSQVQRYAPRFVGYNQQDSQEFLRFLLEGLHDDLNIAREKVKGQYPDESTLSDAEQSRLAWNRYEKREKSVISELFVGQLKSTLTCTDCKHRSLTFDPFWDLSLPIPSRSLMSGKVSLDDCFKKFTQEEVLDGDEKPTCEMCKKRRRCYKQFSIERFPQILVIHLKRFSGMRYRTKLETLVDFPSDLNLSNFGACGKNKKSDAQYRLYGVSNHSGGTYGGHYTAYCRHPESGEWFHYSDAYVSKIPASRVISEEAYVLFYELSNQMSYL